MVTVGEIIREKRLEKKLTLEQVEKTTKIRTRFLDLIENNEFSRFESQPTLKGFIRNYASFLGLSIAEIMAFYRRQSETEESLLPSKPQIGTGFRLTPQVFTALATVILLLVFAGFLVSQYLAFSGVPALMIDTPADNSVSQTSEINVTGKTDADSAISINDQQIRTGENGQFKTTVPLTAGLNKITIKAVNKFQKTNTVVRRVRLEPETP